MKIALAAATSFELQPTINFLQEHDFVYGSHRYEMAITGIGSMATAYHLAVFLNKSKPDCLIQAGVGGAFKGKFLPGDVVMIRADMMGDLGAEEKDAFSDVFDLGLMEPSGEPFHNKRLINPYLQRWEKYGMPAANGVTVNEITTRPIRAEYLHTRYECEIESMEGAAMHYVCLLEKIPFIQIRSVSNQVGVRNKKEWKMKHAIETLNNKLINIVQQFTN